ncbi:sigma-70 family RNA polymerase sigma factor [Ascidiimonas aurantiaca]|uniref:RNA polymerase sigma factor n=1 Tax=Ascidiimonas aurantiaca TaxID=1685432 RepID=UPI0030EB9501
MDKKERFTKVIKENEGLIFKVTTIYTSNRDDQKDLYQDIIYQLWKAFDSFRNESKISTWIYRVALNTAITQFKKQKRRGPSVTVNELILKQVEHCDQVFEERLKQMYAGIKTLNDLEKALVLLYLEGRSYKEIAEISGLTLSNVGTRLSRIKEKLKTRIIKNK